jgi:hypothetical protein
MNGPRGETSLQLGGKARRLCLTLGALAEIEGALGCRSLDELDARMRALSAADLLQVTAALLRGGGEDGLAAALETADLSPAEAARAVAEAFRRGLAP